MRDIAARICRDYLNGAWKTIAPEEIQLRRISGGLSNFLYYVSLPEGSGTTATATSSPIAAHKRPRKDSDNNNNNNYSKNRQQEKEEEGMTEPKEVLLRIYGQAHGDHALEAMLTETVVFALLSERRLGPKLHGIFPGGRIEQYIPARPLKTGELAVPKISMKISQKMAEIHSLDIPVSKEPDWIWKTTDRWLASVESVFNNNKGAGNAAETESASRGEIKNRLRKIDFKKEVQWLKELLNDEVDFLVVFSHNDLQEGNILIRDQKRGRSNNGVNFVDTSETSATDFEESSSRLDAILISGQEAVVNGSRKRNKSSSAGATESTADVSNVYARAVVGAGSTDDIYVPADEQVARTEDEDGEEVELMIIDFEYCSYNYRGFDLANHFLEWTFDYTNKDYPFFFHRPHQFPNEVQRKAFLDTYLRRAHQIAHGQDVTKDDQRERDLLEREIACFTCASHLFWTLWAIVYSDQEIEFGYWDYADCRIKEYFRAKAEYLKKYKMKDAVPGSARA